MKIGIIGSGAIGSALTHLFRIAGHEVIVANSRGPSSLADLAQQTGARAGTVEEAVAGNDVVVVTIPQNKVPELPVGLFADAPENLIVIDTGNYYPRHRDGRIDEIETGLTESEWVERQLGRPVVKAFNTIKAQHLREKGQPRGAANRIALAVGGDDPEAKAVVMNLIDQIGFDTVDSGTIAESWRQQPEAPGYGDDYGIEKLRKALASASHERPTEHRATSNSPGTFASPA